MMFALLLALGCAAGLLVSYAWLVEPAWLRVRRRVVRVDGWPVEMDGLTLLHLSDLHIGRATGRIRRFLAKAEAIPADLVVITGDFI